jgi:uncharacterized membrane protein YdfJ with MMPL/SSD domain
VIVVLILFDFSMDYEVFLASRICEELMGRRERVASDHGRRRLILVPAIMRLLGNHAWYMPRGQKPQR